MEKPRQDPEQPTPTNGQPLMENGNLEALLEQAQEHLQLQMLLIEMASCNEQADFGLIVNAYHFARVYHEGQKRRSGEPFLQHCVEVARILAQLRLDSATVAAGLLHDILEDTTATYSELVENFGFKIARLIDGVTKIDRFQYESRQTRQAETYRKMLLSMVEDIRVILIKFADRLHNVRTLQHVKPEQQRRIAQETIEVYAPLAHRLGLARIRWELEDHSLRYIDPESYQDIRQKVAMKRQERENYLAEFKNPIERELKATNIEAEITGRPKNFYSIRNKMRSRNKPFEEIYDLLAVRIIVKNPRECYHTLGLVHNLYRPLPHRFKDFIANPKSNMYQSLHTTVFGPRGLPVEIQIRTWEMHHTAEIGIAAHWRYKDGDNAPKALEERMDWLRQVLDWQRDSTDPEEFMENLKIELFQDEIFIFTPHGDLIQLPTGATPIDFAFSIHTDIGLHCMSAQVNGHIVSLDTELQNGDHVHIVTSPHQKPRQSWLELVKTTKARNSIRRWLKEERFDHSRRLGKDMLEKELKRYRYTLDTDILQKLSADLGYTSADAILAALGSGDLSVNRVVAKLIPFKPRRMLGNFLSDRRSIRIQDINDLMILFGKCCTPIPGDPVIGLVTRGRGVSVHRTDCPNIAELSADPDRLVAVQWDIEKEQLFTIQLQVTGIDRKYLLADITKAIGDTQGNIRSATTETLGDKVRDTFWVDVKNADQLRRILAAVDAVKGVSQITRLNPDKPITPALPDANQPV